MEISFIFHIFVKTTSMKRKTINDDYFENINTDTKAYLLGFFVADGCISMNSNCKNSYNLSIGISEEDRYILEIYKNEICPDNKISITNYKKGAINRKPVSRLKWTSTKMKKCLESYNIRERKTYDFSFTFPFNEIDSKYIYAFMRGFFDGDGQISYNDSSKQFTFAFYGTSKLLLKQIGEIFKKDFNINYIIDESLKSNVVLYCLRFNSNQKRKVFIEKLYEKFYNNAEIFLIRKKLKFERYLNTVLNKETKKSLSV